jgi:hypothetical protein
MRKLLSFACVIVLFLSACKNGYEKKGRKVEIVKQDEKFILMRDGKPYFIKGAGGYENFDKIRNYGGNSIRIWDHYNAGEILDEAQKYGLTVTLGLDIGKENSGFDYNDEDAVKLQFERMKEVVLRYRDHPALLMWAVGNEVDQYGKNNKVWRAVNDLAEMIHETDPEHPVTSVIIPERLKILKVKILCPDLDILAFNTFNQLPELSDKLDEWVWGWDGPYFMAEWGTEGWWEVKRTEWNAPVEKNSTEKSYLYRKYYDHVLNDKNCLGSYAFYWGTKQEKTPTWFSMFTTEGRETESVMVMRSLWKQTNEWTAVPFISGLKVNESSDINNVYLKKGEPFNIEVIADDTSHTYTYGWEIRKEAPEFPQMWEVDVIPDLVGESVRTGNGKTTLRAPESEGAFRVYGYVINSQEKVATCNVPVYVR